jgi:hypothetical protein
LFVGAIEEGNPQILIGNLAAAAGWKTRDGRIDLKRWIVQRRGPTRVAPRISIFDILWGR